MEKRGCRVIEALVSAYVYSVIILGVFLLTSRICVKR